MRYAGRFRVVVTLAVLAPAVGLVSCGGGGTSRGTTRAANTSARPATATAASHLGMHAVIDGETFVVVRTLPAGALSPAKLESVGVATAADGSRIAFARGETSDVAPWERVSRSDDGWRVWRPQAVFDALRQAGGGAQVASVTAVDWPDACLGVRNAGVACAQVVTPGYRIGVRQGGRMLEYHTDRRTPPAVVLAPPR